jgi:hypothetical protein
MGQVFAAGCGLWHFRVMTELILLTCKYRDATLTAHAPNPGRDAVMSCPTHGQMGKLGDLVKAAVSDVIEGAFGDLESPLRRGALCAIRESGD